MKITLYSLILFGLLITISAERTWNHLFVKDPFIATIISNAKKDFDAIVVGDSAMVSNFPTDQDQRFLVDQIGAALNKNVLSVARCGMPMSAQAEVLELLALLEPQEKAEILVLEVNPAQMLRGVDPQAYAKWQAHLNLVKQDFAPLERLFHYILYLDREMLGQPSVKNYPVKRIELEAVFERLINISNQLSENVFCFITPANYERFKRERSPKELDKQQKDIDAILKMCKKFGVRVEDWSRLCADEERFPDPGYIDMFYVHLDDIGRKILAEKIAEYVNNL